MSTPNNNITLTWPNGITFRTKADLMAASDELLAELDRMEPDSKASTPTEVAADVLTAMHVVIARHPEWMRVN